MGFFGAAHGCGAGGGFLGGLKSTTQILQWWNLAELYLTEGISKKCIKHVTHPLSSADISLFSPEVSKSCYIKKSTYRLDFDTWFQFFLTFLESLVIVLKNMVTILMMSAKITTPGLLKIRVFWNNGYDVIISVHDVINKILSRDSNYIIDVFMWPMFGKL